MTPLSMQSVNFANRNAEINRHAGAHFVRPAKNRARPLSP